MSNKAPTPGTRVSIVGTSSRHFPARSGKYYGHMDTEGGPVYFVEVDGALIPCTAVKPLPKDCL